MKKVYKFYAVASIRSYLQQTISIKTITADSLGKNKNVNFKVTKLEKTGPTPKPTPSNIVRPFIYIMLVQNVFSIRAP